MSTTKNMTSVQVSPDDATKLIEAAIKAKVVPLLKSSPGLGKSSIVKAIADKYKLKLIDVRLAQCDPSDLLGFPRILDDGKAGYAPMNTFPLRGDSIPEGYKGWLIFFDELTSAVPAIQSAAYKIILDRMIGTYHLHDKVAIVAAGNLATDNAIVEEMSTALQSRMVHFEMRPDLKVWMEWAMDNGINSKIIAFLNYRTEKLYDFRPDHDDHTYACPRSWEFASNILKEIPEDSHLLLPALAGTVGAGTAREFIGFINVYMDLPDIADVIKDPENTKIPADLSARWALSGSLADHADSNNIRAIVKYLQRLPQEFQIITLKLVWKRDRTIIPNDLLASWSRDLHALLNISDDDLKL